MTRLTSLIAAFAFSTAMPAVAQEAGTVLATVNGEAITLGHVIALRERLPQEYQQLDDGVLLDGLTQQLIQQTALAATAEGLSKRGELVIENERRALVAAEEVQKLAEGIVSEEDVRAAYDEMFSNPVHGHEFNASHILVETEEKAAELIEQLKGGADFAELAKAESTGPSGPSGGELGWFGDGAMVPEFDAAVHVMEVGDISEPVQTQFGWHVIKLNETRDLPPPAFEEVRDEIESDLQVEALEMLLADVVAKATVERPELDLDPSVIRNSDLLD
ncbi:peptidylprolyl isomerase [Palleronia caenipelagi]|uniref:Parvulin-like PPIase n=1 Tax=Palleronia caenipelagi TaxID=2489174 RepID=A0A547Q8E4_9RHOB|nr:peptidylprolyl isomerase [Palleronia caenipelagi]TRD22644.1 peptidylprolyl isomerase [Palleronia caenipelagi]